MRRLILAAALLAGGCARERPAKTTAQEEALDPRVVEEVRAHQAAQAEAAACAEAFETLADAEMKAAPASSWAGRYGTGMGLGGARLTLAPRSGFLKMTWTDMGPTMSWTYGTWKAGRSALHLIPDRDLVPITWGARHYLVDEGRLQNFCLDIREGRDPPNFGAFLRDGDEKRAVSGRPRTPDAELRCLNEQPLEAHILVVRPSTSRETGPGRTEVTPVVLDVGAKDGVRPDMRFYFRGTKSPQLIFRVIGVEKNTSDALIEYQPLYSDRPRRGWRLSSSWPPHQKP